MIPVWRPQEKAAAGPEDSERFGRAAIRTFEVLDHVIHDGRIERPIPEWEDLGITPNASGHKGDLAHLFPDIAPHDEGCFRADVRAFPPFATAQVKNIAVLAESICYQTTKEWRAAYLTSVQSFLKGDSQLA